MTTGRRLLDLRHAHLERDPADPLPTYDHATLTWSRPISEEEPRCVDCDRWASRRDPATNLVVCATCQDGRLIEEIDDRDDW